MRALVLSAMAAVLFSPAMAQEINCNELRQPAAQYFEMVDFNFGDIDTETRRTLASMYELYVMQNDLLAAGSLSEQERTLAARTMQLAKRIIAVYTSAVTLQPQLQTVLELMQLEKSVGLDQVSERLLPQVLQLGTDMEVLVLKTWLSLNLDVWELIVDRSSSAALPENAPGSADVAEQMLCALDAITAALEPFLDEIPKMLDLLYVDHLRYVE